MSGNGHPTIKFKVNIDIVVEPDEDGFHAYCPALKGLHTCGDTEEEAVRNAAAAAMAYLQSLLKHGDPIPVGIVETAERTAGHREGRSHHVKELAVASV